jgi:hypothetical protein
MVSRNRAAIYLVGHGSTRDPRPIDLQYLRIQRAIDLLSEHEQVELEVSPELYVDLVFERARSIHKEWPRPTSQSVEEVLVRFPALQRLGHHVENGDVSVVLMDILIGGDVPYALGFIPTYLKVKGARLIDVYEMTPHLLKKSDKKEPHISDLLVDMEPDYRDWIAFFPRQVARLILEFMGYEQKRLQEQRSDSCELTMKDFVAAVHALDSVQPYAGRCDTVPHYPKILRDIQQLLCKAKKHPRHPLS